MDVKRAAFLGRRWAQFAVRHPAHSRDYLRWRASWESDPLSLKQPWMGYRAIRWLERHAQGSVFEYGSGGSTLFLASRVSRLVSVEHDPGWYAHVKSELPDTVTLLLEPDLGQYVRTIHEYGPFDLVIVDGRERVACIREAVSEVKPGGWLLLDDSERPEYDEGIRLLAGWQRRDFFGPKPSHTTWFQTSVFRKP